uniref:Uncharacterized protein n=1 Tax=Scleropages formosus TaxID=113540 RepID=A0A8C9T1C2_SCLFO
MAKPTTIKEALARWEEKSGEKASEAKAVKLYSQIPPIEKLDAALSALGNCERLSLSTNCIEKITNLNGLSEYERRVNVSTDGCVCPRAVSLLAFYGGRKNAKRYSKENNKRP